MSDGAACDNFAHRPGWIDPRRGWTWGAVVLAGAVAVAAGCGGAGDEPSASVPTSAEPELSTTAVPPTSAGDAGSAAESEGEPPTSAAAEPGVLPEGFSTVTIEVTDAEGEVCEVCVWLADTADERGRGLMGVTDLGDAAGMLFAFERIGEHRFYMLGTPTPLSIAWFGPDGAFVSSADMEPCVVAPEDGCPRYPPGGQVQYALEVFQGGLPDLGATDGSTLEVLWDTEAASCPDERG